MKKQEFDKFITSLEQPKLWNSISEGLITSISDSCKVLIEPKIVTKCGSILRCPLYVEPTTIFKTNKLCSVNIYIYEYNAWWHRNSNPFPAREKFAMLNDARELINLYLNEKRAKKNT